MRLGLLLFQISSVKSSKFFNVTEFAKSRENEIFLYDFKVLEYTFNLGSYLIKSNKLISEVFIYVTSANLVDGGFSIHLTKSNTKFC